MKPIYQRLIRLSTIMLRIGVIGFGGGNALIPLLQKEVVDKEHLISQKQFDEDVLIASMTPGALPVEIAAGIGAQVGGAKGMFVGAVGMALPGAAFVTLCLTLMSGLSTTFVREIHFLTIGITAFILCMLADYIWKTLKEASSLAQRISYLFFIALIFSLTGLKNIYRILDFSGVPPFSMSTVQIFGITLFLIFLIYGKRDLTHIKNNWDGALFRKKIWFSFKELVGLLSGVTITFIPAIILTTDSIDYFLRGLFSSLISFGGGDAYLTIADGLFVETGMIHEDAFYGSIVPLVNLLPGSILCKTLCAIGYFIGFDLRQNNFAGLILAAAGFMLSIAASGGVFSIFKGIYESFETLQIFTMIRKCLRPIVSGLILTVMTSLVYQGKKIGFEENLELTTYLILALLTALNGYLYFYKKTGHVKMVAISVLSGMLLCHLFLLF